MNPRRLKVNLSLKANTTIRRSTFKKRKRGITKKLDELTTLCDVKAGAVVYSPYKSPEVWPSTEGVEEVVSKFRDLPVTERFKTMMDHETYLRDRITKGQEQVKKLCNESRESQLRQFMFDCVEGKMSEHPYDSRDLQDLSFHIHHYINQLNSRIKFLIENGESSSFPPLHASVAGADHPVVADTATVTAPIRFYDYFQYNNMNMNLNQHEPVQHHVLAGFNDHIKYQNMILNQNQQEPVQYHTSINFNDQNQHGIYDMNSNQNMSLDPNQYMYQQESFMNLLVNILL
uniref:Agamous-like MADS-box protein AGL92 n=1 Tax=Turritis glabra TaxID=63678 RepID=S6C671_TURGL|nr:agamous-like MADS-box protein AGL92 [Turritis glabra]